MYSYFPGARRASLRLSGVIPSLCMITFLTLLSRNRKAVLTAIHFATLNLESETYVVEKNYIATRHSRLLQHLITRKHLVLEL